MAKKTKRPSARARGTTPRPRPQPQRPATTVPPADEPVSGESFEAASIVADDDGDLAIPDDSAAVAAAPAPAPAPAAARRQVQRVQPGAQRPVRRPLRSGSVAAVFEPLPPDDAAIPFDRVPYVPADLRRVAVMAAVMIGLIIVAAILVSVLVK